MSSDLVEALRIDVDSLSLNTLDVGDIQFMNDVFKKFTVFISSSLNKLKSPSNKQGFNDVYDKFLRHILHHQVQDVQFCDLNGAKECYALDNNSSIAYGMFVGSCLENLLFLSTCSRRLLAQVTRLCGPLPSSSPVLLAMRSLLDAHPQKATFELLTSFLAMWLVESEHNMDVHTLLDDSSRPIIDTVAALLVQGPGTSSAGRAQRSYFSLVRAVLLGTANVRISSCKSPVWIVFWDDLWTLLDNAVGIEARFLEVELILMGGDVGGIRLLEVCQFETQIMEMHCVHDINSQNCGWRAEAVRLAACLNLASRDSSSGTLHMFALQSVTRYILDRFELDQFSTAEFDGESESHDNDIKTWKGSLGMLHVLTSSLEEVLNILRTLLQLSVLPHESKWGITESRSGSRGDILKSGRFVTACRGDHLGEPKHSVSKKTQGECISVLATIVAANPFRRLFPRSCSSPTSATAHVVMELGDVSAMSKFNGARSSAILTQELGYLRTLHSLLTDVSIDLLLEEDCRGVGASTLGHLQSILLSTSCGGADPFKLLDLIRLKTAVIGRSKVDSHDVEGQRGVKQLPPGHLLLRELFEQRLCTVDIVLEIADHAVSSWGVVMPRGGVCNGISGNVETGHTMSPLFQCRQLDLLVSIIARHNDETQHRRIFLYLLQSIHRIKASKDHTIDISQLIHLYSLLAAVCSFVGIGEVREENTTVDSKILRWIMEAALQLLEQYVLPRESLNFFQFHASRFLKFNSRLKESSTLPRRILNSDLEVTSDQGTCVEFVFWLHLLACVLRSGNMPADITDTSLMGVVEVLYPSEMLLLPHILPVAVQLACYLPRVAKSSPLTLMCQTLGYFQDIVFSVPASSQPGGGNCGDVVQYIDLIALVVKENIANINRVCRLEVLHVSPRSDDKGGGCDDYMEREQQLEEINVLVRHRLCESIATFSHEINTSQTRENCPTSQSFLGCFIPFIIQILIDGLWNTKSVDFYSSIADGDGWCSSNDTYLRPAPAVIGACLKCWGQYILCGVQRNVDRQFGSPFNVLHRALMRIPALDMIANWRGEESRNQPMSMLLDYVSYAQDIFYINVVAAKVYLQTFSIFCIDSDSPEAGNDREKNDGAVLVVALFQLMDYVHNLSAIIIGGKNDTLKIPEQMETQRILYDDDGSPRCIRGRGDTAVGDDRDIELMGTIETKLQESCCTQSFSVKKRKGRKTSRLKKKGKLITLTDGGHGLGLDEEFDTDSACGDDNDAQSDLVEIVDDASVVYNSEEFVNADFDDANSEKKRNLLLCVLRSAVEVLEVLMEGLEVLVMEQRLKHSTAACVVLSCPLAFRTPITREISTFDQDNSWSTELISVLKIPEEAAVWRLRRIFTEIPWMASRVIFKVSSIYAKSHTSNVNAHKDRMDSSAGAETTNREYTGGDRCGGNIMKCSLEDDVCSRLSKMSFPQQERILRHVLLGRSLAFVNSPPQQQQLEKSIIEEVLRSPHAELLATLLVPPSSSEFRDVDSSSLLYLHLSDPMALEMLHDAETSGHWDALSNNTKFLLQEAQRNTTNPMIK